MILLPVGTLLPKPRSTPNSSGQLPYEVFGYMPDSMPFVQFLKSKMMKKIFLMAAFVLMNAVMVSCTADDAIGDAANLVHADDPTGGQGGTIPPPPPPPRGGGTGG
jgi:hypothetical protein